MVVDSGAEIRVAVVPAVIGEVNYGTEKEEAQEERA